MSVTAEKLLNPCIENTIIYLVQEFVLSLTASRSPKWVTAEAGLVD